MTAVQAAYDGTAAATGKESWTAFALNMVALVTFSFGKVADAALSCSPTARPIPGRRSPRAGPGGWR